ncbi:rod shape-determining protein MreC [bacterium]|nr:rod shape-determining protein MreC [bacterium]
MRGFLSQHRAFLLAVLLVLLGLHLATSSLDKGEDTGQIGRIILDVYTPVHAAIAWPIERVADYLEEYVFIFGAGRENKLLRDRVEELTLEVARLREAERENDRLRTLVAFREERAKEAIVAKVIARNVSQEFRTAIVNKGRNDGVERNMIAYTPNGLVGHVTEATARAAKILLIVDGTSVVDAVAQSTRASGLVRGRGAATCVMEFVQRTDSVEIGDSVVSSGVGGVFPSGFVIGAVTSIDNESNDMFQNVEITPAVNFADIEEILIAPGIPAPPPELAETVR